MKIELKQKKIKLTLWFFLILGGFVFNFLNQIIEQSLNNKMSQSMRSETSSFFLIAFLLMLNALLIIWIIPIYFSCLIQIHHPETKSFSFLSKINDFSKEWLRSLGVIALWFFVFIIPGIIKLIDFSLLPFVCFFDVNYQSGRVDALKRCQELAKNHRLKILGILLLFGVFIPLLMSGAASDSTSLTLHPILGSFLILVESIIQTLSFWFLWKIYLKIENKNESLEEALLKLD